MSMYNNYKFINSKLASMFAGLKMVEVTAKLASMFAGLKVVEVTAMGVVRCISESVSSFYALSCIFHDLWSYKIKRSQLVISTPSAPITNTA